MKHLLTLSVLCFLFVNHTQAETFKNTNENQNGKTFGQLMSWVFDGEKSPERIEIETSDEWQKLQSDQVKFLKYTLSSDKKTIIFSSYQSDEGGRFYHNVSKWGRLDENHDFHKGKMVAVRCFSNTF